MKTSLILNGINILSTIVFQVAMLDLNFFSEIKKKLLNHEKSRIQTFSNHSILNERSKLTEKSNPKCPFGANDFAFRHSRNDTGIQKWIPYLYC